MSPRDGRKWPKPANFIALSEAYVSKDPHAIAREEAAYNAQLRDAGFPVYQPPLDVPDRTEPIRSADR